MRVFQRVINSKPKHSDKFDSKPGKSQPDSNLSNEELAGLKSLRKKIKNGSLIVCDTDKSKRFAILSKEQYLASGALHTSKDIEISPGQIKRVQNTINDHVWCLKI